MEKCTKCEFLNSDIKCWSQIKNTPRLCELAHQENREDYKKLIHDKTLDNKTEYPKLIEQVSNLKDTVLDFFSSGLKTTTKEEQERRLSICKKCEFFDLEQEICMKCGCYLKYKTLIEISHCPLDPPKW